MATYTLTIDETNPKGKTLLEFLKTQEDIINLQHYAPTAWEGISEEEEHKILGKLAEEALQDPDNKACKMSSEEFFKKVGWK